MIDQEAEPRQVLSKRTHLICLISSIIVYCLILMAINRSGFLTFPPLTILESDQLPSSYVEGTMHFSEGGRNRGSSIVVWLSGGGIAHFSCHGVNWEKYPNAIPCRKEGYAQINGKPGRLWYLERTTTSRLWGERKSKLAVQLQIFPNKLYSFNEEKTGILAAKERNKTNPVLLLLKVLIHFFGVLAVLILSWAVADRLLTSHPSRPAKAGG